MLKLKELRKSKGISQQRLADELCISQQSVNKYENNISFPSLDMLLKIAKYFEVSVDYLVGKSPLKRNERVILNKFGTLSFTYGVMSSSKTAQALMQKFSLEEHGHSVLLLKPAIDTRDGDTVIKSRVGIQATCNVIAQNERILEKYSEILNECENIIVDEAQFLSTEQINELRHIADSRGIDVYAYGLRTDFRTQLFEGAKRLLEIADHISEIKVMCECGRKAIVSARIGADGEVEKDGEVLKLGGNETYKPMCCCCWNKRKER